MVTTIRKCPIWGVDCTVSPAGETGYVWRVQNSFRAGGDYEITFEARHEVGDLDDKGKARLTSILVEQWIKGIATPRLTADDVHHATESQSLSVHERSERLLRFLVTSSYDEIGQYIHIGRRNEPLFQAALGWSESTKDQELDFLSDYLENQMLITKEHFSGYMFEARVEIPGYRSVEELEASADSSQCFVAMWFDDSMSEARNKGIIPAIQSAGYNPVIIDQEEFLGKIDDKIIAEIRRSKFMVADFTHRKGEFSGGKCLEDEEGHRRLGARGGVYYEAGFAEGVGLDVIPTCRSDMIDDVHFDTRQLNHIVWDSPEDLRVRLENRIRRVIGEGPITN